jgi:nitrogen regulatory protein P-II 2
MKLIIAYIKEERFKEVKAELERADVLRVSVSRVKGSGQQQGYVESYRGVKEEVHLLPKIRLEMAVNDSFVEKTINAIIKGAKTGSVGDGKIFVLPLEECIRIRTGERGMGAIGGSSEELERERGIAFSKSIGKNKG